MSMKLIEVQARMISLRERILREGNPVSNDLPEVVDQMLQDLAQSTGAFSYNDIIQFSKIATPQSIATLRRYAKKFNSIADDNGEPDEEDIKEVSKIVRQGVTDYRGMIKLSNENSKGLRESMRHYIDPEFPCGGMGIFEFPNGFLFVDGSDPGDVKAYMYLKENLPNDIKVEALWAFLEENEPEVFEYIPIDGDLQNPVRRQLLRYKESFKEMGASKVDVDSIAHYIQEEVWGGEEEEEDW